MLMVRHSRVSLYGSGECVRTHLETKDVTYDPFKPNQGSKFINQQGGSLVLLQQSISLRVHNDDPV